MCGIIGEVASTPVDISTFVEMRDELAHRGPDGDGLYTNDDETVALGHRRLSIIDLSDAGSQPMMNENGDIWLVFNGEIYNYQSLRDELQSLGHEFSSETDSEVIIHGYEEWGMDCLQQLRGMFAFGLWDERLDRMFLARDRLGIKPLYYFDNENRFIFSSELKGILADERIDRTVDRTSLRQYLNYRYVPSPRTIWEGMYELEPGTYLTYEDGATTLETYWTPESWDGDWTPDERTLIEETGERISDAVETHLVSDVDVGTLLSGGLDSSLVTSLAHREDPDLTAFSMGFESAEHGELEFARFVAEEFDIDHMESVLSAEDSLDMLDELLYYYDEPLADTSIFPTFLLMREVSEHVKVVLSGDGGDELFAGYDWYERYLWYERFDSLSPLASGLRRLLEPLADRGTSRLLDGVLRRLKYVELDGVERYRALLQPQFDDSELKTIYEGDLPSVAEDSFKRFDQDDLEIRDLQLLDVRTFLPEDILVKVDRASMAHSLEVRVPLLDHLLAQHALSLSPEVVYGGQKKRLLKEIARRVLPSSVIDREKQGFGAPLGEFRFVEEHEYILGSSMAAEDGILSQSGIDELLETESNTSKLFRLLMFELWYRKWRHSNDVSKSNSGKSGSIEST